MQSKKERCGNAPGVKTHFISNQTHSLKDTLCLAQPPTHPAAFQPSPSERAKYKPDAPKCLLEDIPFHLVIAASEGKDLKRSSNPLD